ncbi:MAG: glycosyltransferase [Candidatus Eiseniibacteriota bacterium]
MRILLLAHAPSVHTRRWAMGLAGRGHEVRLLSAEGIAGTLPDPARLIGWRLPIPALRYASASGAVRQEVRSFLPDVTVAHFLPNYGLAAALAGAKPLMLVCWGSDLLRNADRTPFHQARARYVLRRADLVHVDATNLERAAVRHGADPARVWTRAWGIDVDAFATPGSWSARRAAGGPLRILWMRQLEPVYDPVSFVRALAALAKKGVPFRATMAGTGPLLPSLQTLASEAGIKDSIAFAGWVEEADLPGLYRAHDVYVSLSRSDSTSQSLLEAMAAGLLPVVTDIDGNLEWVRHRQEGFLVPVSDPEAVAAALAEAARRPESVDPLVAAGRTAVAARARFADTLAETERRLGALAAAWRERPRGDGR